jgi:hypothetical protein
MLSIRSFRNLPHFARSFAHVHVLCWPILWWNLNRLLRLYEDFGYEEILYAVTRWGHITIRYSARKPDPSLYKPIPRTFRPLTDESWGSALPCNMETRTADLLTCEAGGLRGSKIASRFSEQGISLREMTEGALPSQPNTS